MERKAERESEERDNRIKTVSTQGVDRNTGTPNVTVQSTTIALQTLWKFSFSLVKI